MTDASKYLAVAALLVGKIAVAETLPGLAAPRERISINNHRRFNNGDPTSFESFQSHERKAFSGLCLVIVRAQPEQPGKIKTDGEI